MALGTNIVVGCLIIDSDHKALIIIGRVRNFLPMLYTNSTTRGSVSSNEWTQEKIDRLQRKQTARTTPCIWQLKSRNISHDSSVHGIQFHGQFVSKFAQSTAVMVPFSVQNCETNV